MVDRLEAIKELAKRGKLPADFKPYYDEAVKRGLISTSDEAEKTSSAPAAGEAGKPKPIFPMGGKGALASQSMVRDAGKPMPHIPEAELMSQGLSGVNEGISNFLSLPATIGNAALSVGPAIANAVAPAEPTLSDLVTGETPKPRFAYPDLPDPGKPAREVMKLSGAIRPPGEDLAGKVVRRVGQEVGAALPLGITRPIATVASAIGSGLGAATAQEIAPGNPYAEFAGQILGGAAVGGIGAAARKSGGKAKAPKSMTGDELQQKKTDAYEAADRLGARYSPQGMNQLANDIATATANASPIRHPKTVSIVSDIKKWVAKGMSLTELDQLRQRVRLDLIRSGDEAEGQWGQRILSEIDNFIAKAGPGQMAAGNGDEANKAILAARELNTRWRKTEMIEDALYAADMRAAATGSGGNINNKIKQAFNSILLDKEKRAAYSADEIADMEKIVKAGKGEDLLRLVGKLSPSGNGLMAALGIGGTAVNPLLAGVPLVGMGAKALADGRTTSKAAALRAKVAAGPAPAAANTLRAPALDPVAVGATLVGGMANNAANENERRNTLRLKALN